jgi:hypothetical protein
VGINTYTYPDGSKYEGEWQNNKRHGRGIWTRPDGMQFDGEWVNDKPDGQGTLSLPNGQKRIGLWKEGKILEEYKQEESTGSRDQDLLESQRDRINELEATNQALNAELKSLKQKLAEMEGKYQSDPFRDFSEDDYTEQLVEPKGKGSGRTGARNKKPARKLWWLLAAALLIIFVIIVATSGGEKEPTFGAGNGNITEPESVTENQDDAEPNIQFISINDKTTFAEWEYKVIDVQYHKILSKSFGEDVRARGTYVVFMLETTNNSNTPRSIGHMFQLEDDKGRVFDFDSSASLAHHQAFEDDTWHLEDVGASFTATMPIAFDIPDDAEVLFFYPKNIRDNEFKNTYVIRVER